MRRMICLFAQTTAYLRGRPCAPQNTEHSMHLPSAIYYAVSSLDIDSPVHPAAPSSLWRLHQPTSIFVFYHTDHLVVFESRSPGPRYDAVHFFAPNRQRTGGICLPTCPPARLPCRPSQGPDAAAASRQPTRHGPSPERLAGVHGGRETGVAANQAGHSTLKKRSKNERRMSGAL